MGSAAATEFDVASGRPELCKHCSRPWSEHAAYSNRCPVFERTGWMHTTYERGASEAKPKQRRKGKRR